MTEVLEHGFANIVLNNHSFRLRRFPERLVQFDAAEIRDERADLIDIAGAPVSKE